MTSLSRRQFLTGTAAIVATAATPLAPTKLVIAPVDPMHALFLARVDFAYEVMQRNIIHTIYYGSSDAPLRFNGFQSVFSK